jgi:hypothetical protein
LKKVNQGFRDYVDIKVRDNQDLANYYREQIRLKEQEINVRYAESRRDSRRTSRRDSKPRKSTVIITAGRVAKFKQFAQIFCLTKDRNNDIMYIDNKKGE